MGEGDRLAAGEGGCGQGASGRQLNRVGAAGVISRARFGQLTPNHWPPAPHPTQPHTRVNGTPSGNGYLASLAARSLRNTANSR